MASSDTGQALSTAPIRPSRQSAEPYHHSPLPTPTSIRVLDILPPEEGDVVPVHCDFKVIDLNNCSSYDALSYTWGLPCTVYSADEEPPSPEEAVQRKYEVICEGRAIKVTANCLSALIQLRSLKYSENEHLEHLFETKERRSIWIDAICINQAEDPDALAERAAQVRIMNRIYRQAKVVIIWLGPEDKFSLDAIICLELLASCLSKAYDVRQYGILDERAYRVLGIPFLSAGQWASLYAFLGRAWFYRAWIVQEVVCARNSTVLCGNVALKWSTLSFAALFLQRSHWDTHMMSMYEMEPKGDSYEYEVEVRREGYTREDLGTGPYMSLYLCAIEEFFAVHPARDFQGHALRKTHSVTVNTAGLIVEIGDMKIRAGSAADLGLDMSRSILADSMGLLTPRPLTKVLWQNMYATCARPEDRIYAFIGLAPNSSWSGLSVDYVRPVRETFVQAAWAMIKSSSDLRPLSFVEERIFREVGGLPTWVPDFSARRYPNPLDLFEENCPYSAAGEMVHFENSLLRQPTEVERLSVKGIQYDKLLEVRAFDRYNLSSINSFLRNIPNLSYNVLWRTLIADIYLHQHPAPTICGRLFSELVRRHLKRSHLLMLLHARGLPNTLETFLDADTKFRTRFAAWQELEGPDVAKDEILREHDTVKEALMVISNTDTRAATGPEDTRRAYETIKKHWGELYEPLDDTIGYVEMDSQITVTTLCRLLFRTSENKLGLGPKSTKEGDEVWLLAGTKVPYILRPVGDKVYEFVGEAFLHGIMDGEVFRERGSERQTITLV